MDLQERLSSSCLAAMAPCTSSLICWISSRPTPGLHPSGDPCRANWFSCRFVIAKLAALAPKPKGNLSRFHGVFAPNSKRRVDVTTVKPGIGSAHHENEDKTPQQRYRVMTWV
jgi:hypothetical protein